MRDSNNLIEAVFANIIDGVAVVDRQDKITAFNQAALTMFDYSHDRLLGQNWHELLNEDAEQDPQDLRFDRVGGSNEIPISQIWKATGKRKSGELFPIEISIGSIPFKDHRIAIIRDITERIEATNQLSALNNSLHKTNHSLIQSNRELEQFTYITAHDLKAPLRAISGLSEWVEEALEEHLSAETRGQMQLLRRRVHRMQSLLDGLLEYSRAGRIQYPIVTVDVNRTIEKIVLILDPPATFTIDIETPMPTFVTHLQPLEQVFIHLIDNAIRHHPTKMGVVKIHAIDLGDYYEFTVADNGEGIEPEYQTKIYRIFQTLKARDFQENVGAGLAIVQKIVTTQGGTINLESIPGNGATFRFTWPKQIYL